MICQAALKEEIDKAEEALIHAKAKLIGAKKMNKNKPGRHGESEQAMM
jgi:hypothetical protein